MKIPKIFRPKNYNGVLFVNGKSVSILNFKMGGDAYLTDLEDYELKQYINRNNL